MPPGFVIQEHFASTHHFDFRLERDGVYKSWALPKGVPKEQRAARLAMATADHDLAFGNFEGTIPKGEYGAGAIRIWDQGSYEELSWNTNLIRVRLSGIQVQGEFVLRRFAKRG